LEINNLLFDAAPVLFTGNGVRAVSPLISVVCPVAPFGFCQTSGATGSPRPASIAIAGSHPTPRTCPGGIFGDLFTRSEVKQYPSLHILSIANNTTGVKFNFGAGGGI